MAKPSAKQLLTEAGRISQRIRQARIAQEFTQDELAKKAGLSRSAVVHYEQSNAVPGGIELVKLAQALKLSPNYLLSGSDDFFKSPAIEHALAVNEENMVVARTALCFTRLDREVREAFSAMLMALVKAKLNKREYQEFIKSLEFISQSLPDMEADLGRVADKAVASAQKPPSRGRTG